MIRRLNYTGRKLIPHEKLLINVRKIDGKRAFNAELELDALGFCKRELTMYKKWQIRMYEK